MSEVSAVFHDLEPVARQPMTDDLPNNRGLDRSERLETQGPQHISPIVAYLASDAAQELTQREQTDIARLCHASTQEIPVNMPVLSTRVLKTR